MTGTHYPSRPPEPRASNHVSPKMAALLRSHLFEGVSPEALEHLAERAEMIQRPQGKVIIREGEVANGFFIVESGSVKVYKTSADGAEHIIEIFKPLSTVGEAAVFAGCPYPASAATLEPTELLRVPRDEFVALISQHPETALAMLATLSERLRSFTRVIEDLSLKEVSARLSKYLIDLSMKQRPDGERRPTESVTLEVPKYVLARRLGTVAETLSRTFTRMRKKGVIEVSGNRVQILDRDLLEELASGLKL